VSDDHPCGRPPVFSIQKLKKILLNLYLQSIYGYEREPQPGPLDMQSATQQPLHRKEEEEDDDDDSIRGKTLKHTHTHDTEEQVLILV
jgi:hypothetical protein